MKKLSFAACLATALAYGADVVYMPNAKENGIYDWRTVGNWYTVNGGALGALPTADDTVYVTNTTFARLENGGQLVYGQRRRVGGVADG